MWEGGVAHFVQAGSLDYYHCDNFGCDRSKPISLFLDDPDNATTTCKLELNFQLPKAQEQGIFTLDVYGEDLDGWNDDFVVNFAYNYDSEELSITRIA